MAAQRSRSRLGSGGWGSSTKLFLGALPSFPANPVSVGGIASRRQHRSAWEFCPLFAHDDKAPDSDHLEALLSLTHFSARLSPGPSLALPSAKQRLVTVCVFWRCLLGCSVQCHLGCLVAILPSSPTPTLAVRLKTAARHSKGGQFLSSGFTWLLLCSEVQDSPTSAPIAHPSMPAFAQQS